MQNKIFQFLRSLSKREVAEFGKFVSSPYHNNRRDVIRYYGIVVKYYPAFEIDENAREIIYEELYPGKKYDANTLAFLNSFLYTLGKKYMAVSNFMSDEFSSAQNLLRNLDKHNSDILFEKEYKKTEVLMNNNQFSRSDFQQKAQLEEIKIDFNLKRSRQYKICQNTIDYSDYLTYSFIVNLAITYHNMFVNKSAYNYEFTNSAIQQFIKNFNFDEFIEKVKDIKGEHFEHLVYYYYLLMCYYYPEESHYYPKLKEYSLKDFGKLKFEEKVRRFNYLIDYCIHKIKSGNSEFLSESFNVYKETLKFKLYHVDPSDERMGLIFFRNFIMVGLAAKEYDEVENFISQYSKQLEGDVGKDLLEISNAMLHYEKKNYDKALDFLSRVKYSHPVFRLDTKHLSTKIYYDTNDYSAFFSLIDAYRHYLKNDKSILPRIRDHHSIFVTYASRLGKIRSSGQFDQLFSLRKEIKDNVNMDFRHKLWLTKKIQELENNEVN